MTSLDPVLDAFKAWQASRNPREYPAERQAFYAGWLAAMLSPGVQALRKDAERYRWLRDDCPDAAFVDTLADELPNQWDALIDALKEKWK